jgi:hypothetical protein
LQYNEGMFIPNFKVSLDEKLDRAQLIEFTEAHFPLVQEAFPQIQDRNDAEAAINYTYKNLKDDLMSAAQFIDKNKSNLKKLAEIIANKLEYKWDGIDAITIIPAVCPVCPRFIENNSFMVAYFYDQKVILRICAHEMVHFLYFKKLRDLLPNEKIDTEYPSKDWLLSEIVAPLIVNLEEVQAIVNNEDELFLPDKNVVSKTQVKEIENLYCRELNISVCREKALKLL